MRYRHGIGVARDVDQGLTQTALAGFFPTRWELGNLDHLCELWPKISRMARGSVAIKFEDQKRGDSPEKSGATKDRGSGSVLSPAQAPSPADDEPLGELPFGKPTKAEKKGGRKAAKA